MKEKTRFVQFLSHSAIDWVLVLLMTLPHYLADPAQTTRPLISTAARAAAHTHRENRGVVQSLAPSHVFLTQLELTLLDFVPLGSPGPGRCLVI